MADKKITALRDFPSIEQLLQDRRLAISISSIPRPLAAVLIRDIVSKTKQLLKTGKTSTSEEQLIAEIKRAILARARKEIQPVINATGIVVHTNLGRAPISREMFDSIRDAVTGYTNVEFDLTDGKRGKRGEACEEYLSLLAGTESATVVNNCAAALFLILNTLSNRKEVIISRGELVQIGGGFRIPDILRKSGAKLHEIGSTNITTLKDYEDAISEKSGLILKVHKSNFAQDGFTDEVEIAKLVQLGQKHNLPVVNDLGSGVLFPTDDILNLHEPTVQQSVKEGADLTCFSGDKLLGGLQAGLIVGRSNLVARVKKNPVFRTVRVDKLLFAMIERLIRSYLDGTHTGRIKLWQILTVSEAELYKRGKAIQRALGNPPSLSVEATQAYVGGGALPQSAVPSVGIIFGAEHSANKLSKSFRDNDPPIIGRIEEDRFVLDLKTVDEHQLPQVEAAIRKFLNL